MINRVFACVTVMAAAGAAVAGPDFYGVTNSNLVRFDMGAHTVTVVGPLNLGGSTLNVMADCDFDGMNHLWAIRQGNAGGFPPTIVNETYQIDVANGNCTFQANVSSATLQGVAFRASNTTFYSANNFGGTTQGKLVTANLANGTVAGVGNTGLPALSVDALAFAPDGMLYGMWNSNTGGPFGQTNYKLVRFDITTGAATIIGSITNNTQPYLSLRFDSAGVAYTVDYYTGDVFTVNLTTGQGTLLFAGGASAVGTTGLASVPGCPADFNGDNMASISDIFAMISAWFRSELRTDYNHSGGPDIADIFTFLGIWFHGCP